VTVAGTAATSTDPDDVLAWTTRCAARYMGEAEAERYGRRNATPSEMVVRVTPTKVTAKIAISD
jgi:hypothetical protein